MMMIRWTDMLKMAKTTRINRERMMRKFSWIFDEIMFVAAIEINDGRVSDLIDL